MDKYTIAKADDAKDYYAGTKVPGEFRRLTENLGSEQVALTFIRIPAHSDFEQSTGHFRDEIEEIYLITKGILTMRFDDDIVKVSPGTAVRVSPKTVRSHRNEGDEVVEMWAMSKILGKRDSTKVDDFWPASDQAKQTR